MVEFVGDWGITIEGLKRKIQDIDNVPSNLIDGIMESGTAPSHN